MDYKPKNHIMKIEVKNIKIGPGSQETLQYVAEVYVDGKKLFYADNSGHGGMTNVQAYSKEGNEIRSKIDTFLEAEAKKKDANARTYDGWLEDLCDDAANAKENEKAIKSALKKLDKATITKIIIVSKKVLDDFSLGKGGSALSYSEVNIKQPIALVNPEQIKKFVDEKIKPQLKGDQFIYNKNLPA